MFKLDRVKVYMTRKVLLVSKTTCAAETSGEERVID